MAAAPRQNNFGANVANVFQNAPNAAVNAANRLNNFGANVANVFQNAPNVPNRLNNFGPNVGNLFQNAPNAALNPVPNAANNFGPNVANLFQNAPNAPNAPLIAAGPVSDIELQDALQCAQYVTSILQRIAANPPARGGRRKSRSTLKRKSN